MQTTSENNERVSPITDSCRAEFLGEVRALYEDWIKRGVRYEWGGDDEESDRSDDFQTSCIGGNPTPEEWLIEYTGEREANVMRGIGCHYRTYSDIVYDRAGAVTWNAYEKQYGSKWYEDDELIEAQDADWSKLNVWIEDALTRCDWSMPTPDDPQPRREGN